MQDQSNEAHSYDPNRLLDALLDWLKVSNDKQLSRLLQVSLTVIRNMRAGRLPVRGSVLYLMAERAGKSIQELRLVLGDRRCKVRVV